MTHPLLNPTNAPISVLGAVVSVLTNRGPQKASELRAILTQFAAPDLVDDALERLILDKTILQTTPRGTLDPQYVAASDMVPPVKTSKQRDQWFGYRHIVPLFTGTPEFIVERLEDNKLYAWCPDERTAARITEALNRP